MSKQRLDVELTVRKLVPTRSQGESWIRLGKVNVNGEVITKPGFLVSSEDSVKLEAAFQYVSRAALKLQSADESFCIDWRNKIVLDVGSSTGGFTQYALQHGAAKVIAVDVGTQQLHPDLRSDPRIELHEKTDIRDVTYSKKATDKSSVNQGVVINQQPDIVVGDVSFISLRIVLPTVARLMKPSSVLIAMVKPQFEAGHSNVKHRGIIKNDRMRRAILKDFEEWSQDYFKIIQKKDSSIPGSKGNVERFYVLQKLR